MIKFSKKRENNLKDRINAIFTLIGTILVCIHEFMNPTDELAALILKITVVIVFFWFILGKICTHLLFMLLKEIVEDQSELDEDVLRRTELHEFDQVEKAQVKENIQKVKF